MNISEYREAIAAAGFHAPLVWTRTLSAGEALCKVEIHDGSPGGVGYITTALIEQFKTRGSDAAEGITVFFEAQGARVDSDLAYIKALAAAKAEERGS